MSYFSAYLAPLLQQFHALYNPGIETKRLLRQAADCLPADAVALPDVSRATFQDFHLYLAQNEWELAMEVLEELATGTRPPATFWGLLAQVAERMKCDVHAQRYRNNSKMK
ncbi:hypothetical protein [Hymenobacter terrestris]|uniref:Uncharacterized protein n=1 Tax=Hymenobacter terrestris TaxID=2748310 RepID=A0ABX2Q640_9BACT|nr:hypothetical protein [Hymenobacter terrestris]NVO86338.1 hypothetical protein [Hymenobacter terrestris]